MTDAKSFKKKVSDILNDFTGVKLFFFVQNATGNIDILESKVENEALRKLKDGVIQRLREDYLDNDDLSIPLLSNADERKNALYLFDYEKKDFPKEFSLLNGAKNTPVNHQNFYHPKKDFSDIRAMSIVLYGNNNSICLYKHKYNLTVLKQTPKALNLFGSKDALEEITTDVLKIDFGFEMLLLDDEYFIKNLKTLETAMKFHEVVIKSANLVMETIKIIGLVEDTRFLKKRLSEMAFSRKLAKIAKHSPVLGKILPEEIVKFTKNHKYLSENLTISNNGKSFIVKTRAAQDHFIKLLSDNYLESELTRLQYISLAKDVIQ